MSSIKTLAGPRTKGSAERSAPRSPELAPQDARATLLQSAGNRATRSLMLQRSCGCGGTTGDCHCGEEERGRTLQAKLASSTPGDPYELEADRVAEQIMRTPLRGAAEPPRLQRLSTTPSGTDAAPPIVDEVLQSGGEPLESATRAFMEGRLGYDLSHVRVHTDAKAAASARAVQASAYTVGSDIVFGAGRWRPGSTSTQRLLAHELTHVVQQAIANGHGTLRPCVQRTIGDGHDLRSNRFSRNTVLEAAFDNETTIAYGATGVHVTILQQALVDAGFPLPVFGVYGFFGVETEGALKDFQRSKGLTGAAVDGIVNGNTMDLLDQHFVGHRPERALAARPGRPLLEGTRSLTADERTAVTAAITTEPRTSGGALPVFHRTIPGSPDPYEVRIARRLNEEITRLHATLVASRPARVAANLMTGADINRLAQRAKTTTDAVFGRYRTGPALVYGVNITDQFVERSALISASTRNADSAANFRVMKILDGDSVIKRIDTEHGAVKTRPAEWALIAAETGFPNQAPGVRDYDANPPHVTTGIVGTRRAELLAIHRNWPASASGGTVHLQRYLGSGASENRDIMYRTFATIIHEYIHTLEAPQHQTHRRTLPEQRGGFVLREGMTDYLAKVVWDNITFDATLRAAIEDRFQDPASPNSHPIPRPPRYQEWINAERAVGIVGIRNALAAFFLGRVDLIGGP